MTNAEKPSLNWSAERAKQWLVDNFCLFPDGKWFANYELRREIKLENDTFDCYLDMMVEGALKIHTNDHYFVERAIFEHLQIVMSGKQDWTKCCDTLQQILKDKGAIAHAFFAYMDELELTTREGFLPTPSGEDIFDVMVAYRAFLKGTNDS